MKTESNIEIRHARADDKAFWLTLDKHISPDELDIKIRDGRCYIKLGYTDCGSMTVRGQAAAELFLIKYLR